MVGYIYLTTDTTNGMQYVGQHHYNKEGELDPNYHGSGVIISRIYKERPETLKEEYIKTCYSDSEMNDDEKYYIKLYKTLWPNGYNLSEGGDGGVRCEETRRKISNSHKGLQAGEKNPMYGKHHSEETKNKISVAKKGKNRSEETKQKLSKKVLQFSLSGEFIREWPSTAECGRNGFNQAHVSACCRGKVKSHKGFIFKFKI